MKTEQKRFSWVKFVLVVGHLAIILGLAVSALSERRTVPNSVPGMSILESFQLDGNLDPR